MKVAANKIGEVAKESRKDQTLVDVINDGNNDRVGIK